MGASEREERLLPPEEDEDGDQSMDEGLDEHFQSELAHAISHSGVIAAEKSGGMRWVDMVLISGAEKTKENLKGDCAFSITALCSTIKHHCVRAGDRCLGESTDGGNAGGDNGCRGDFYSTDDVRRSSGTRIAVHSTLCHLYDREFC